MIAATQLTKTYQRRPVLQGVTFTAMPGEITLLVGPNGAGKSTTIKVLAGIVTPDRGEGLIGGKSILRDKLAAQRLLSYLPQTPSFHPRFTCAQIVDFYLRLRGLEPGRRDAVLDAVGLTEVANQQTRTLSGGMRQRLGMALLLLPDAEVLLLDEPSISLDAAWRRQLQVLLQAEAARGKTVLVTTHLVGEWNNVAKRCLLCEDGVIRRALDPGRLTDSLDGDAFDAVPARDSPLAAPKNFFSLARS